VLNKQNNILHEIIFWFSAYTSPASFKFLTAEIKQQNNRTDTTNYSGPQTDHSGLQWRRWSVFAFVFAAVFTRLPVSFNFAVVDICVCSFYPSRICRRPFVFYVSSSSLWSVVVISDTPRGSHFPVFPAPSARSVILQPSNGLHESSHNPVMSCRLTRSHSLTPCQISHVISAGARLRLAWTNAISSANSRLTTHADCIACTSHNVAQVGLPLHSTPLCALRVPLSQTDATQLPVSAASFTFLAGIH